MTEETQCLRESEKDFAQKLFTEKVRALEEELKSETEIFEKTGFYSNRDTEEIEKELKIAKNVLNNIDDLPKCP